MQFRDDQFYNESIYHFRTSHSYNNNDVDENREVGKAKPKYIQKRETKEPKNNITHTPPRS